MFLHYKETVRKVCKPYHSVILNVVKNLFFDVSKSRSFDKLRMTEQNDSIQSLFKQHLQEYGSFILYVYFNLSNQSVKSLFI